MTDGTAVRLDTVDIAVEFGWEIGSILSHIDEFSRDGVAITVQYAADDHIESIARQRPNRAEDFFSQDSGGKNARLRGWLSGRESVGAQPAAPPAKTRVDFSQKPGDWTRDEFVQAVEDAGDRAFLLRFLELVDANDRLPAEGVAPRLWFGTRPGGAMFVYPSGRRFPPFKFSVRNERLRISGCWTGFPSRTGHAGFADLASMLDLDHTGSAPWGRVSGLDPDKVWAVGESVSRAINLRRTAEQVGGAGA